ncbi:MAG: SpoIIE family protein phosphatase [Actinomycetota bacterium]|nr:SpoIIE family protein phosphatase [Actinomycetota bacterium]
MSVEENKALVRRFLEAHAKGDLDALEEMLTSDFVNHNLLPSQEPGREGYLRALAEYHAAFSDIRYVIEKQVAEGDEVVTSFTVSSTHDRGEWLSFVPTGKEDETLLILIHRIVGGKIAEEWSRGGGLAELTQQRLEQEMRERERIEQELLVARRIQQASLPKAVPKLQGWQISPYIQPAREVGGDFYEFFELEDGRVGFAVGDATGKGVPAAFVMTGTCAFLGGVATASGASPGEVLARVNEAVLARIPANMFVTCFYAILDPKSGRLSYANAGHNLPCCRHEHAARELEARGMPLGLMPGMTYEEKETVLELGESVLFYTDGLVEAHNPQGEMFGTPRLRSILSEHPMGGTELSATLMEELERFTEEGWEQEDDITLLTLERAPTRT